MVKVCHLTSAHDNNDVRIFRKECISLANAGYDVYLIACGSTITIDNVKIIGVGDRPKTRLARFLTIGRRIFKKAIETNAEIFHIHDPELLPLALRFKRRGNIVIYDSHEDFPMQIFDKKWIPCPFRKTISFLSCMYQNYVLKRINAVITVTPHISDKLRKVNKNTYVITNYPKLDESICFNNNVKLDRTICFAGGISPQWNHETILKTMQGIKDVKYVLCGFGESSYLDKLKDNIMWRNVIYYGQLAHHEALQKLSSSSVGMALLSKSGNTGWNTGTLGNTKLFEYMYAGIPVICTDFILWKDIIEKNNCGICVNECNEEEIIKAITFLLDNNDIANEMGRNGHDAIIMKYNWAVEEKKLINIYKSVYSVKEVNK